VDNGGPWGSAGDLPPDLALWLLGLGIAMHWNDARRPQQNGVVERAQGTGKRWAEPEQCATAAELQRRLQQMDVIQREAYPSIDGQSRVAAFPGLAHSGRRYSVAWERRHWDRRPVGRHQQSLTPLPLVPKRSLGTRRKAPATSVPLLALRACVRLPLGLAGAVVHHVEQ
jgi:hypothetical protein